MSHAELGLPWRLTVKNPPAMQETWVQSLGQGDPLEQGLATHSSILAWEISGTEEPGRLQPMGSRRIRHDLATKPSPPRWNLRSPLRPPAPTTPALPVSFGQDSCAPEVQAQTLHQPWLPSLPPIPHLISKSANPVACSFRMFPNLPASHCLLAFLWPEPSQPQSCSRLFPPQCLP